MLTSVQKLLVDKSIDFIFDTDDPDWLGSSSPFQEELRE